MKRMTLLVIASLFCFVLMVSAEAPQRRKHKTPQRKVSPSQQSNKQDTTNQSNQQATQPQQNANEPAQEKEEATAQQTVVVKSPLSCISDERKKENEEVRKRLGEVMRQILADPYRSPPSIDNEKRFTDAMKMAFAACKIREIAEIRLALHDKNLKKEQLENVSQVATKMVAEFNARGGSASFSSSERGLMKAYLRADNAADVIEKAASPTLTKGMKKEQIQHATEAGKAVLTEFNEKGEDASFSSDNERVVEIFLTVVLATETTQKAQSPKLTKNLKKEEIQAAVEASNRILAEFNANEWKSRFADSDEEALENFRKALSPSK